MTDEERFKVEDKKKRAHYHEMGLDAVVDRLRMERRKRNLLPQTMFDLFDIDNNGSLSVEELEDALVRMKMPHTGIEVEGMVYLFDLDRYVELFVFERRIGYVWDLACLFYSFHVCLIFSPMCINQNRDGLLDYREFLNLVTGGTSVQANEYRLYKKNHPLHEPPHFSSADEDSDEHSSYLVRPPNTKTKKKRKKNNKNNKNKNKNKTRHRKGSISLLDNTVNKIPPEHRRLNVTIHGAEGKCF